jgi:hypothetical protein
MNQCNICRMVDDHAPWCTAGDPGERSPHAIIWEKLEELDEKLDRLAEHIGLPPDWDDG